jgi:NADPH-dependent 2,4-dienoyl-CoA reductase/sulfur reductase-like enzyme
MTEPADLIVIGAGPAGLAAASLASKHNLSVLLLDEQAAPGGQIYRNIEHNITHESETCAILGAEYAYGAALAETCRASDVTYTPGATVWRIDPDGSVAYSVNGAAHTAKGRRIILATGALERPVPIPGWTLPGVMTAGAAQTLLKASAMLPSGRVVVAGTGPLAMLVTLQLIDAGADIAALLETTRKRDYFSNAMLLPGAMAGQDYLRRGMAMRRAIRASGVPIYGGVTELEARGDGQVSSVRGRSGGERLTFEIDTLLVHDGVVPNIQATRQVGCELEWYEPQRYWRPVRDSWGTTSIDTITVAGDGAGISGARAAEYLGQLAALDAACRLDKISMRTGIRRRAPSDRRCSRIRQSDPYWMASSPPRSPRRTVTTPSSAGVRKSPQAKSEPPLRKASWGRTRSNHLPDAVWGPARVGIVALPSRS